MMEPNKAQKEAPEGFNSLDSDIIYMDGPWDHTVRPIPRSRWAQAKALRDLIYGPSDLQPPPDQPQE